MPNTYSSLSALFTAIANAIRGKTGGSASIVADNFPSAIAAIDQRTDGTLDSGGKLLSGYTAYGQGGTKYTGSIPTKTSSDMTASGATVTAPAGYYASSASKSVAAGTAGTPSAAKGTVSNNSVSVTPSVTNSTGYITGGTKTGTPVTVSASELVSGTKTISESGTTDVTNYKNASVAAGSATTPDTTITATPSISVSSSGLITASVNVSKDITPTVSEGYVSTGTGGTVTVSGSNTSQLTTKATQTYNVSSSDQGIAAGQYITGAQRIRAVTTSNITPENIKKGVVVKVGDAASAGRIKNVTGTYDPTPETVAKSDVNFYDYDGSIVASYTAAAFANLSALPSNPTHEGLTAQGWNYTLADAKAYVASYGKLDIGQMYVTDDGKTRIYIKLEEGRLSPYLGIAINGTATIEWGDGQTSTVTRSDATTVVSAHHTYASAGEYVIKIAVSGSMALIGNSSYGSQVLWKNSTPGAINRVYQNAIQKVEIGANTTIGEYAFYYCCSLASVVIPSGVTSISDRSFNNCYSLASVVIPSGVTSISERSFNNCYSLASVVIPSSVTSIGGTYAFGNCNSLASVVIPSSVTSIGGSAFNGCYSLASVVIPSSVTSIGTSAFSGCYGLGYIKFTSTAPPTVANANAWSSIPTDCIIYVPRGYLSAYTSAANYPSSSSYTYVEYDP